MALLDFIFRPKTLKFDEECVHSFALARIFAAHNNRKEIAAADILCGLLHTGLPQSMKFATVMKFGYADEVNALKKLGGPEERSKLGKEVGVSRSVKKILARANRNAARAKQEKIGFRHFLRGLIEERPHDVSDDLAKAGKTWSDLENYEKSG